MSLTSNMLMDRKKLKRNLLIWKLIAIFALLIILLCAFNKQVPILTNQSEYIARVRISGIITEEANYEKVLSSLVQNPRVKALILHINSPGGTEVGSEIIFDALRDISTSKPVVAIMGTIAASGGYMIACAADYILARNGSITGSIGIILQTFEAVDMVEKIGIKPYSFKSAPLKGTPSPFERITPQVEQEINTVIMDNYDFFVKLIAERRKMTKEEVLGLADGRIFTGSQAVKNKLIDAIGGEKEALIWLQESKNIKNLPIHDINLQKKVGIWQNIASISGWLFPNLFDIKQKIQYGLLAL
ncbi:Signal peptide peptidase A [Rickettsiales bacterium Ac37b]|nr:Signal peptide peptidase A [Rickettsiales bacterium Ac37b]